MVSTPKQSKVSYAERVLGAFSQLQREHRKHDIHIATLRAQIKRHAEAKNEKLGPHWTHWVSKAITKLEGEGILEHTVPGTVALTSDGKKTIVDARRSLQIGSPQKNKDDLSWKQIATTASRGIKRSRKSFASNRGGIDFDSGDDTASRAGKKSPRKRPRVSAAGSSPKKSPSKLTKLELQNELASVKQAYAAAIRRPSSPLTDLSDQEDDQTAKLKEKFKERDQAIENMRRELSLMRNEISREENQISGRSDTHFNVGQTSSPTGGPAAISRLHTTGVVRTQSGSYILNLSKQPTPAPSSSEREDDYGQGPQGGDYGVKNPDMAMDGNAEALPVSRGNVQDFSVVIALKSEIQELQEHVARNLAVISSKETEISDLEKDISDRDRTHESIISDRDGTIASLKKKVSELQAETSDLRETMKSDLEQANAECIEAKNAAENVRNQAKAVSDELHSLKILRDEQASKIEGLVDSLSRASNDAEALQENSRMLEASVARYEAEIQKKDEICQNLETQAKEKELFIAQISADLQTAEKSVEDMRIQLVEANKKVVDAESVNKRLRTNLSSKEDAVQQYQNDLATVQGQFADAQAEIIEWGMKHADDTRVLSSTISDLRDALATANGDIEKLTSRLQAVEDERSAFKADLMTHVKKTQELKEELRHLQTSKEAHEATISSLRASFIKLRQSQLQIFGEFEQIISV